MLSVHNLHHYIDLMRAAREAIEAGRYREFAAATHPRAAVCIGLRSIGTSLAERLKDLFERAAREGLDIRSEELERSQLAVCPGLPLESDL